MREYVAAARLRTREMFVPLNHRPDHAQADFGEADGYIGGKKVRYHYFCMDLPHSDGMSDHGASQKWHLPSERAAFGLESDSSDEQHYSPTGA